MKKFKPQGGLAALEVMIVAAIVAIFATVALPKMARVLGKVQLDYEMKHLYSTLELGRSLSKSAQCSPSIFTGYKFGDFIYFEAYPAKNFYVLKSNTERDYLPVTITIHRKDLTGGVKITSDFKGNGITISPNSNKQGVFTLTSKFGEAYVKADTVGRFRGTYEK